MNEIFSSGAPLSWAGFWIGAGIAVAGYYLAHGIAELGEGLTRIGTAIETAARLWRQ